MFDNVTKLIFVETDSGTLWSYKVTIFFANVNGTLANINRLLPRPPNTTNKSVNIKSRVIGIITRSCPVVDRSRLNRFF